MKDEQYYQNLYNEAENELNDLKKQVEIKTKELKEIQPFCEVCATTAYKSKCLFEERPSLEHAIRSRIQGKKSIDIYSEVSNYRRYTNSYSLDSIDIMVDDESISVSGPIILVNSELNSKYTQEVNDMYDEWLQLFDKKIEEICTKYNLSITDKNVSSITSFRYTISNSEV